MFLKQNTFETKSNSLVLSNRFFNSFFEISEWQNFLQNQLGEKPKDNGDILPANIDDIFYKEGDFRIHFTALNFEQRQAVMEEYAFRKDNPDRQKWKTVNYKRYIKGWKKSKRVYK